MGSKGTRIFVTRLSAYSTRLNVKHTHMMSEHYRRATTIKENTVDSHCNVDASHGHGKWIIMGIKAPAYDPDLGPRKTREDCFESTASQERLAEFRTKLFDISRKFGEFILAHK